MKESIYRSYDELPLFLNAEIIAQVLGVSPASTYELMHEAGFPTLRIGSKKGPPAKPNAAVSLGRGGAAK